jgi:hypothetical protein
MFLALSLALLTAFTNPPAAPGGAVRGHVRSESTGEPLGGAIVELVGVPGARQVIADSTGAYRVDDIPSGRRLLRARHLGYAPLEMEVVVPAGREVQLDVVLRPAPVPLPALRVRGTETRLAGDTAAAPDPELARAASRVLQASPGLAELGLGEPAQGAPGQDPPDPSDVLYVRGTGADLKLVYLDGAPVYAPFPLGGILDAFSPHLLRSADLHLGGAPAKYDGGLSYVLDLRTRAPSTDRADVEGAVDLLSARALAETPLGARSGLLVSARGVHAGAGALLGDALPYGYREVLTRADVAVGGGALLSVTAFGNGEEVWLDDSPHEGAIRWGNGAASAHLRANVAGTSAEITAAVGDYDAHLPAVSDTVGAAEGSSRRTRLAADFSRFTDGVALRYGVAYDRQDQEYRSLSVRRAVGGDVAGGYVEVGMQVAPSVRLRGGVRADHYSLGNAFRFAPRLSATWLVSDRAALTLAAGRYHQYLRPPESALLTTDTAKVRAPVQPLALGSASHLALTLDQELGAGVRLGVEGYYKSFHDVPSAQASDADASGVDVWVRRTEGPWNGWLGYSLAWVWSVDDRLDSTRFAGRQLLTAGVEGPLGSHGNVHFGVVYGAGLPYSAISLTSKESYADIRQNSDALSQSALTGAPDTPPMIPDPDRPYLRIDLGASRTWSGEWRGAHLEFSPYVRLLNTLGQRDALFYRYERGRDTAPRPLLVLPIVPVIGAEWKI